MKLHTTRRVGTAAPRLSSGGPGFRRPASCRPPRRSRRDAHAGLLLDPRGTGGTADAETYLLDDYVGDVEELRNELGEEQIDLLGFSHGGLVAAAYAIVHPSRLQKLVLAVGLAAFTPEMETEAKRTIESRAGEPWYAAATAALAREEAGDYATYEDGAEMWNAMAPLYFSRWEERYRPLRGRTDGSSRFGNSTCRRSICGPTSAASKPRRS